MDKYYGMSMETFMEQGYGWVVKAVQMNYKRALTMGEYFTVRTGIETIDERGCRVIFSIISKTTDKVCSDGWFDFVMIDMKTNKGIKIPEHIMLHYKV